MTRVADFEVIAFFVADHAEAVGGKAYVNGGFWNRVRFPSYPAVLPSLSVVAVIGVPFHEYQEDHQFAVTAVDADGNELPVRINGEFRVGAAPDLRRGDPTTMPVSVQINGLQVPSPGDYSFVLSIDEVEQARYPIRAVQVVAPLQFQLDNDL